MNPTEQKILILIVIFAVSATVIPLASDPVSIGSAQNYLCGINVFGSNLITCTQPNDNFTITHGSGIQMKSFQANKTIWINATSSGGGSGEVNTASNLAGSLNWFASKVGVDLQFRGLNLGSGLTGSQTANTVTLDTKLRIDNGTCSVGYVQNGQNNVTGARNCILDTSGTGTYNKTLANNVVKNSGGSGLNFVNGTNNPLNIVNDPTRNQVNITVNVPSSSSDNDPAPKVSINALNRSSFINMMQTNSSVLSDLTDVAGGGTTNQVLTKESNGTWIAKDNVHAVRAGAGTSVNGTTNSVSVSANVHGVTSGAGTTTNGTTGTVSVSANVHAVQSGNGISVNSTTGSVVVTNSLFTIHYLAGQWDVESTKTNIGTSFVDVYTTTNSNGHAIQIDTNGFTKYMYQILWVKQAGDAGTQTCQFVDIATGTNILTTTASLVTGVNTGSDTSIPAGLVNSIHNYKWQCKSTTSTDDPVFIAGRIWLKP